MIKEDPQNPDILYVGTDNGLYVSLDKGKSFNMFDNNFPAVAVHDVVIHAREHELIVGTHGRSIYIANIEHLQMLDNQSLTKELLVFDLKKMQQNNWGEKRAWEEPKTVNSVIPLYVKNDGIVNITVKAGNALILKKITVPVKKGLNYIDCELTIDEKQTPQYQAYLNDKKEKNTPNIVLKKAEDGKTYLQKGKYTVDIEKNGVKISKDLIIAARGNVPTDDEEDRD